MTDRLDEGNPVDRLGDALEKAHESGKHDKVEAHLKKAKTSHLQTLHLYNMGYSGARKHPVTNKIHAELKSRNAHKYDTDKVADGINEDESGSMFNDVQNGNYLGFKAQVDAILDDYASQVVDLMRPEVAQTMFGGEER